MTVIKSQGLLLVAFLFSFGNIYLSFTRGRHDGNAELDLELLIHQTLNNTRVVAKGDVEQKAIRTTYIPTIDVLSTGTLNRPDLHDAQERTFGSHRSIRSFVKLTELDDNEKDCSTNLTVATVERLMFYCGRRIKPYETLEKIKRLYATKDYLMVKPNPAGWMCAQKRPLDGFQNMIQQYKSGKSIPDYLFFVDDDTYINMNRVVPFLTDHYPADEAHAVAGCLARTRFANFTFAFGGYGTFLTKPTIERFLRPIHCRNETLSITSSDDWEQRVCDRISQDQIGERYLFVSGMSVADLMHAYVIDQPYTNFDNWDRPHKGFCLHSDTTLSYFMNYYFLASHTEEPMYKHVPVDRLKAYNGSHYYSGQQRPGQRLNRKQCLHKNDESCDTDSDLCHYITPQHMDRLHGELVARVPDQFVSGGTAAAASVVGVVAGGG